MARKDGILDVVDDIDVDPGEGWAVLSDVRRMIGRGLLLLDIDERDIRGVVNERSGERSAIGSTRGKFNSVPKMLVHGLGRIPFVDVANLRRGHATLRRPASKVTERSVRDGEDDQFELHYPCGSGLKRRKLLHKHCLP